MTKISCDVCMDLIPLVKDNVASKDSSLLVEEHIKDCTECYKIFNSETQLDTLMDDKTVVKKIKKHILFFIIATILLGISIGMIITDSMNIFYNALIMPAIGALGYIILKKNAFISTLMVFAFSSIWTVVSGIFDGAIAVSGSFSDLLMMSFFYATIYAIFSMIGIVIAWSLSYAFKKEENQ